MANELHLSLDIISAVKGMDNFANISFTQTAIMTSKTTKTILKTKLV